MTQAQDNAARGLPPLPSAFVNGARELRELTTQDGALPAPLKALFMAGAAAAKRDQDIAARHVERAQTLGIGAEQLLGAALALRTSRGEGAYECFVRATGAAAPTEDAGNRQTMTAHDAIAHFREYFGAVPDYVELLAEHHHAGMVAYATMRHAVLQGNPLGQKDAELILCTINAIDYVPRFVEVHAGGALRAGATPSEIIESVLCAVPIAGVPAWIAGGAGIATALAAATG